MNEYSIDRASEKIYNPKTKKYFEEVLSSYAIGNYRSAIVMLYSVIIADLVYKLKELSERDEDPKALTILNYIRTEIENRDRSNKSEWETKVVERVFNETQLLEPSAKVHIEHIKQLRHLSAHPVLDSDDLLATPSKDTVRSAMQNALDYVLIRPAMYNDKIAEEFMNNIPSYSSLIFRTEKYETYLKNKYFNLFTDKLVKKIFKFLWLAVYRGKDDEAIEFREEYFDTLNIVYKNYKGILDSYFEEEKSYFNRLNLEDTGQFKFLIDFFCIAPHLYQYISEDNKILIKEKLNHNLTLYTRAWFITNEPNEHLNKVIEKFSSSQRVPSYLQLNLISDFSKELGREEEFFSLCINSLDKGGTYVTCLKYWKDFIRPYIDGFSSENILKLLSIINSNSSLYNANWLITEYLSDIKKCIDEKSYSIANWDNEFKKLPKYSTIFVEDNTN